MQEVTFTRTLRLRPTDLRYLVDVDVEKGGDISNCTIT
jgi:hypothetical protein